MHQINGCQLILQDNAVLFDRPIWEVIEVSDIFVVLLDLLGQPDDINNVYGVKNGEILWRVQDLRHYNPAFADPLLSQGEPYAGIDIYSKNQSLILGTTVGGFRYLIDPTTGKIVGEESWVK